MKSAILSFSRFVSFVYYSWEILHHKITLPFKNESLGSANNFSQNRQFVVLDKTSPQQAKTD
jgi:hypothetical protein